MRAVLDRIEDAKAVILVEDEGKEYVIDEVQLPEVAKEGDILEIKVSAGVIVSIIVNNDATIKTKSDMQNKLQKMRSKKNGSKFKRN